MKLDFLGEMAAKKLCDKCGKSMSANHYWYQGGWKCKKEKAEAPAVPTSAVAAVKQALPKSPASPQRLLDIDRARAAAAKGNKPITVEEIQKLVPEIGRETSGDDLSWQVTERDGKISVMFDYTFRRNTHAGAFYDNMRNIQQGNAKLQAIADRYKANVIGVFKCTLDGAKASDAHREGNGDSAYSEYEQSLGGGLKLKVA